MSDQRWDYLLLSPLQFSKFWERSSCHCLMLGRTNWNTSTWCLNRYYISDASCYQCTLLPSISIFSGSILFPRWSYKNTDWLWEVLTKCAIVISCDATLSNPANCLWNWWLLFPFFARELENLSPSTIAGYGQETNRNFGCSKEFGMYGPSSFGLLHFGKSFWTREMLWMC